VQLQNAVEHSAPVALEGGIAALLGPSVSIDACTETTLTLQQPLAENRRMVCLRAAPACLIQKVSLPDRLPALRGPQQCHLRAVDGGTAVNYAPTLAYY
jgi:hypothetical protein